MEKVKLVVRYVCPECGRDINPPLKEITKGKSIHCPSCGHVADMGNINKLKKILLEISELYGILKLPEQI